jgi:hypothetical protein
VLSSIGVKVWLRSHSLPPRSVGGGYSFFSVFTLASYAGLAD